MNLIYDPTMMALRHLVDSAHKTLTVHNIVVDFDGEVIIDPEMHFPGVDLNRYKFRTQIRHNEKTNPRTMQSLFQSLLSAFNKKTISITIDKNMRKAA